ncbi:hypothetical protein BMW23_0386 [Bodo saltans virus]|uniref:Holliday junction resolvase n=1 Tax=Bodo saltans virus TaxID=2024608 RepID=A0A2H4UU29_9VIRU|nr:hypothetical protein QJ851_gp0377 [Bodo saltans virus]ATZ80440.1 hypothetical protein BMW23_0386 [Bodo saltans virus]
MRVLSLDVAIKNLAYCVMEKKGDEFEILKWGIIDLVDDRQKCVFLGRGDKLCQKDAKYDIYHKDNDDIFCSESKNLCVCQTHKDKSVPKIIELSKPSNDCKCVICGDASLYTLNTNIALCWCDKHYKKNGLSYYKKIVCKKITGTNCNKKPIQILAERLFEKLDSEKDFLNVDEVLIENQPHHINPTVKTVSSMLFSYFIMRSVTDKNNTKSTITDVKFFSPSNKLKVNKATTDKLLNDKRKEASEKNKTDDTTEKVKNSSKDVYDLTKNLGKVYCSALINDKDKKILDSHKKKDDLCDSFLMLFQYMFSPIPKIYADKLKKAGDDYEKELADKKENKNKPKIAKGKKKSKETDTDRWLDEVAIERK